MHSARSAQVAEVALLPSQLGATDAPERVASVVGEVGVTFQQRRINYGGGRRPLARSLLGCLCRFNNKLLSRESKGIRHGHAGIQPGRLGSWVAVERGGEVEEGWVGFHDG